MRGLLSLSMRTRTVDLAEDDSRRQFELKGLNAELFRFQTHKRRVLLGTVIFLSALGMLFAAVDWSAIATGTLSLVQLFGLLIVLGVSVGGIAASVSSILRIRKGASYLTISNLGLELSYPDGEGVRILWSDPRLSFELIDCSEVNPSKLLSGNPYSISVRGVRS